ncbi:hypothetical protein KFU94_66630 [Chloroflexi bacterium TSY]|nr:hypothetical protein [Chloroflexi bacterium TSY]
MSTPILATKLYCPSLRSNFVSRSRLIKRLNEGLYRKLTLVSAPAGFGKTTLVRDWLRQLDVPVAWLSLDEGDNELSRFLIYLIATLQQAIPGFGQATQSQLESGESFSSETLLTNLINEMTTSTKLVLVLDDYHFIKDKVVHQATSFFLDHLPVQLHLVITSRHNPFLPLSRLRARQEMTEIRADDLRFSNEETHDFLNQIVDVELPDEDTVTLTRRTEGWITGLHLAALSIQERIKRGEAPNRFVAEFAADDRLITDYLVDEVLVHLPENVRTFLLQTSILERMTGPLCEAVCATTTTTESRSGQETLEQLEQANLFIVPLDNRRQWYRYHHLFANFLRLRLRATEPDRIAELHRRASRWHEAEGMLEEAIQYAVTAEDYEYAAPLIDEIGISSIVQKDPHKLLAWVNRIPAALRENFPHLCIYHAWALTFTRQPAAAEQILSMAESNKHLAPHSPIDGYVNTIRSYLGIGGTAAIKLAQQALEQMAQAPNAKLTMIHQGAATISLADNYALQGDLSKANKLYHQAITPNQKAGNIYALLGAYWNLGDLALIKGDLHEAVAHYRRGLETSQRWSEQADRVNVPVLPAQHLHLRLGMVLYQWNELTEAEHHVQQAVELFELGGMWERIEGYKI